MVQYTETDNRIKIKVPIDDNDESKKTSKNPKTESKEVVKEVKILMEGSKY